jgi:hypothetical protein
MMMMMMTVTAMMMMMMIIIIIIIRNCKKSSHIGHCTHATESANVKVQNIFHTRNNITCSNNCKYKIAATLHTLEMWFVSGM